MKEIKREVNVKDERREWCAVFNRGVTQIAFLERWHLSRDLRRWQSEPGADIWRKSTSRSVMRVRRPVWLEESGSDRERIWKWGQVGNRPGKGAVHGPPLGLQSFLGLGREDWRMQWRSQLTLRKDQGRQKLGFLASPTLLKSEHCHLKIQRNRILFSLGDLSLPACPWEALCLGKLHPLLQVKCIFSESNINEHSNHSTKAF